MAEKEPSVTEEEFLRLPYASKTRCSAVTYDGEGYLVMTLTLTDPDVMAGTPDGDRPVKFVLDHQSARKLLLNLGRSIEGLRLSDQDDPNPQFH